MIAPSQEQALREREAMLEWWDTPPAQRDPRDERVRSLIARLALQNSGKRRIGEKRLRRFAETMCAAYAVARMDARSLGITNAAGAFARHRACASLDPSDAASLAIGFAVLWERLR